MPLRIGQRERVFRTGRELAGVLQVGQLDDVVTSLPRLRSSLPAIELTIRSMSASGSGGVQWVAFQDCSRPSVTKGSTRWRSR